MSHPSLLLAIATLSSLLAAQRSPGPGAPGVRMTELAAAVRIVDGVATTTLRQVVHNDTARQAEAIWVLPLPEGAVADHFEMTVGGQKTAGEVLGAGDARRVYERIVRRRKDPGLLEYMGRGCLRARIFPIPPRGDAEVEVVFRQVLPELAGLHRWTFPVHAAGLDGRPPEQITLDLSIASLEPLRNVFSPIAGVDVVSGDDHHARASFEGRVADLPRRELSVFYGLSEEEFGLNLLTYRSPGSDEGSFMMLISPKRDWGDAQVMRKSITFVLDTSGSMSGSKIAQAKGALRFFLGSLHREDRFNVVPFSTEPQPFFDRPVSASEDSVAKAMAMIGEIEARAGTNISGALEAGMSRRADPEDHVPIVVFLTDGLPTVGVTDSKAILERARQHNAAAARVFVFGVGSDVDTHLLDTLAADSGGARDYVRDDEDIEEKTGALFTKLSHPVMTDLALEIDGVRIARTVPSRLPDLFKGGRLAVFGRYRGTGQHAIRLAGTVRGQRREYVYEGTFARDAEPAYDFVPSLWAARRVGVLLDAIRLNGQDKELMDEIVRLGREHRIVTPYTSHLILEEGLRIAGGGGAAPRQYRGPGDVNGPQTGSTRALPGGSGPSTPGAGGSRRPTGPATGGSGANSDSFFLGAGKVASGGGNLAAIAARLREAGVLPKDAADGELEELARRVVREMQAADHGLRGLGAQQSGKGGVDETVYLAQLLRTDRSGRGEEGILSLFTKKVRDKVFLLRQGVWVDRAYDEKEHAAHKKAVEAYSDEYFDLIAAEPGLRPYLAFSARLVVVLDDKVYEIVPEED